VISRVDQPTERKIVVNHGGQQALPHEIVVIAHMGIVRFVNILPVILAPFVQTVLGILELIIEKEPFEIKRGDRIAQMVFCPVIKVELVEVKKLDDTDRSEGGFGSTGGFNE